MADKEEDPVAIDVVRRWEKCDRHLREERRNYWLNRAFYEGKQWVWWDTTSSAVQLLPARFYESERVRVTVNKIQPRTDLLVGTLADRDLTFEGQPSSPDDQSLQGSNLAVSIVEAAHDDQDWESHREDNILNCLLGGTSAVVVEWNPEKGEKLSVDPSNQKVTGTGEVSLNPLSIAEFSLQAGVRRPENANWFITATAGPPELVKEKYGITWDVKPDTTRAQSPTARMLGKGDTEKELTTVYTLYEKPNRKSKKGKHVVVVNEKTVINEPWPFPFDELNVTVFRQQRIPMRWYGNTFMNAARPVQVLYNSVRSNIAEHIKLASNARLWVPAGSLDDVGVLTDEAGEIVEYNSDPSMPVPSYQTPPPLNRSILDQCEVLSQEMDDIMHSHDVSRGQAPGDRNSGLALSILAEKNNTPLGPMSRDQARGWGRLGSQALKLYEGKVSETRTSVVVSKTGIPSKVEWTGKKLRGQTDVRVPLDATAPHSRAQMIGMLQTLQQMNPQAVGAIPVERLLRLTGLANERQLSQYLNSSASKAHRENDLMSAGQVAQVADFDDHATHISEHNDFRSTTVYENLPANIRKLIDTHVMAHQQMSMHQIQGQAALNAVQPGLGAAPQAGAPVGSALPPPIAQQMQGAPQ